MNYTEWCEQVAKLVRTNGAITVGAVTVITGGSINRGPINYLDQPLADWFDDITPEQAANEIIRRIKASVA